MNREKFLEAIDFLNKVETVEYDITTDEQRLSGQKVVEVEYVFENKTFRTKPLYYLNVNQSNEVRDKLKVNSFFGEPVFWLDNKINAWPQDSGTKLANTVIVDMANNADTGFASFLNNLANDDTDGWIQWLSWDGRSAQYSINLENNNHWHDLVVLLKAALKSKGEPVDKKYFSRLVFQWQNGERASLHPEFGSRAIISSLYKNIKSIQTELELKNIIEILTYKKQVVLQGPPGTGKTYTAKKIAAELMNSKEETLNPSVLIDDFVKNYKPVEKDLAYKQLFCEKIAEFQNKFPKDKLHEITLDEYVIGKGSRDSFCWWIERGLEKFGKYAPGQAASYVVYFSKTLEDYKVSNFIEDKENILQSVQNVLKAIVLERDFKAGTELYGESFILKILHSYYPEEYFPINGNKALDNALKLFNMSSKGMNALEKNQELQSKFLELKNKYSSSITSLDFMKFLFETFKLNSNEIEVINSEKFKIDRKPKLIQFHPSYTYEDFVRGIVTKLTPQGISYNVENKILADIAQEANDNPENEFVLIIDEINRANLPTVLGELIYALEYRGEDVESMYELEGKGRALNLPENLYIIGTMNTADRSVGHIDYAIRRRFAFRDILPDTAPIRNAGKAYFEHISELFIKNYTTDTASRERSECLASDFKPEQVWLGHSYFMTTEPTTENKLPSEHEQIEQKLETEILPLLREYVNDGILLENETRNHLLAKNIIL